MPKNGRKNTSKPRKINMQEHPAVITHWYDATRDDPSLSWKIVTESDDSGFHWVGKYTHNHPRPEDEKTYNQLRRDNRLVSDLVHAQKRCRSFITRAPFDDRLTSNQQAAVLEVATNCHRDAESKSDADKKCHKHR